MKRYKLLKDLPYAKAGEVFERVTHKSEDGLSDYDYLEIRKRVKDGEDETSFGIKYNYFLNNFDDWFEEISEPTDSIHWKPKIGDRYWTSGNTSVYSQVWKDDEFDRDRYESGRVYKTKQECEKARDRELAEVRLRRTSTFKPDFKNGKGGYSVGYDYIAESLRIYPASWVDAGEPVRYETEEDAQKSIDKHEKEWLAFFGIKKGEQEECRR